MKQTAVDFLELMFLRILSFDSEEHRKKYKDVMRQAKEMEKQQQGYSEEEVLESADYLGFKQITSEELNSLPYQPFITDEDGNIWIIDKKEWFNKFKKK